MIMKKILLTLACVFGMSTVASALTSSAVLLQHNGNITTYAAEDIAKAMAAAADGDEVFLNEGKYPGFTISSAIKIKGAGQTTIIDGNIVIENTDKDLGDIFIGFLKLEGSIEGKSTMNKLDLMQCNITKGIWQSAGTVDEMQVDRCDIASSSYIINLSNYYEEKVTIDDVTTTTKHPRIRKFTAINSKVYVIQQTAYTAYPPYSFINCYVYTPRYNYLYGVTIINSLIDIQGTIDESECIYCAYRFSNNINTNNKLTSCYYGNVSYNMSISELEEADWMGNDGTVVGHLGGTRNTPFTLVPVVPRVTESSLKVDPQKKELNVTVTVTPK